MVCKLHFSGFFSSQLILSYSVIKKRDAFYLPGDVIQTLVLDESFTGLRTLVVY